jgi:hypothetical protein
LSCSCNRFFQATAQAISAFAVPTYKAGPQLEYLVDQERKRNLKKSPKLLTSINQLAVRFADGLKNMEEYVLKKLHAVGIFARKLLYRLAQVDVVDDEDEEQEEGEGELDSKLHELSLKLHEHPEVDDKEIYDQQPIAIFGEDDVQPF